MVVQNFDLKQSLVTNAFWNSYKIRSCCHDWFASLVFVVVVLLRVLCNSTCYMYVKGHLKKYIRLRWCPGSCCEWLFGNFLFCIYIREVSPSAFLGLEISYLNVTPEGTYNLPLNLIQWAHIFCHRRFTLVCTNVFSFSPRIPSKRYNNSIGSAHRHKF